MDLTGKSGTGVYFRKKIDRMSQPLKAAIIGFGRMGRFYFDAIQEDAGWEVKYVCDIDTGAFGDFVSRYPETCFTTDESVIFSDAETDVVILTALADTRVRRIKLAVEAGKHIISEKPIADSIAKEWEAVRLVEGAGIISAANLYLRNSWYHHQIKEYIESGEIGELAVIRICHQTPGLSPGEGHEAEGPAFHDCGMHYVDIARWLAGSEYKTMRAQGLRMWSYKDPWWLQAQGTFESGVVFDITQSHAYGQLAKDQTHLSYVDILGTKGVVRMHHDFKTAVVELRGVTKTEVVERDHGEKNIGTMLRKFAASIEAGRPVDGLPQFRDAAVASEFAWKCIDDAWTHDMPAIGTAAELEMIHYRRSHMTDGYGLIRKKQ